MVDRSTIERFNPLLVSLGIYPLVPAGVVRKQVQPRRPSVTDRRRFQGCYGATFEPLTIGDISRRQAARGLGIDYATLYPLPRGQRDPPSQVRRTIRKRRRARQTSR